MPHLLPDQPVSGVIVLTYQPPIPNSSRALWTASTGHPNTDGGYLQARGYNALEALLELGRLIAGDPITYLRSQAATIILPDR